LASIVDKSEILGVLQGFNPWWRGSSFQTPAFQRLAFQACLEFLLDETLKRAVLLSGPRRVGKTTILHQIAKFLLSEGVPAKSILYVSLDHPILKLMHFSDVLKTFHEFIQPENASIFLLLDEIQYAGDWATEVKLLVDHKPLHRILATGSSSVAHHEKLAESGVGRWVKVPIPTLSFYEFLHIRGETPPNISDELRPGDLFKYPESDFPGLAAGFSHLLPSFQKYLIVGGFPETARQEDISLSQRLWREDMVERVLKRDMTALFRIRNVNDLERLFIYLCLHTGGIIAHKTCADALGINTATVANYLSLLEQANLIYCLPPTTLTGKKVLKARNKYYLVDAALRNAVLLRGEEILTDQAEMGLIVETTVLRHVYAYYYRDNPRVSYWRDSKSHKEVDIVVESPGYTIPMEVKYRDHAMVKADSGLKAFAVAQGIKWSYFITKDEKDFGLFRLPDLDATFLKIPAHILTYLLGQAERLLWT